MVPDIDELGTKQFISILMNCNLKDLTQNSEEELRNLFI